jgi:hypothetical protein
MQSLMLSFSEAKIHVFIPSTKVTLLRSNYITPLRRSTTFVEINNKSQNSFGEAQP